MKKDKRAMARICPINLRRAFYKLIEKLLGVAMISRVFHLTSHTSRGSYIPEQKGYARLVSDYCTTKRYINRPQLPMMSIDKIKGKVQSDWKYFFSIAILGTFRRRK